MSDLTSPSGKLSALIQIQRTVPAPVGKRNPVATEKPAGTDSAEHARAVEAAHKFESLLIHNMLKGMRKTTLSEGASNERALYDDMLDEKLAATLMDSGGLGVAEQILSQISPGQAAASATVTARPATAGDSSLAGPAATSSLSAEDTIRIRELAQDIRSDRTADRDNLSTGNTSATGSLFGAMNAGDTSAGTAIGPGVVSSLWREPALFRKISERQSFIEPLLPHARRNARKLGTSPAAVLAIAALETGWGKSMIRDQHGVSSHNLFGIKATSSSQASTVTTTTEFVDGVAVKQQAAFKIYEDPADAVDGFASFLLDNPRYSTALQHAGDPERFLRELHKAGYATDPDYAEKAISVMNQIQSHPLPL
ncbi:MAG: flagellar assembly peptidoglycan hydrolase FlgJ [Granulosicoccus sp.]|nr:flagellar assembly peptidoglycan hydrolase FlgJ [Granulosicoccus sp.]